MASNALKLDLQDPWMGPLAVDPGLDAAHHSIEDRAPRVLGETGVVEATGRLDGLGTDLHLGIGVQLDMKVRIPVGRRRRYGRQLSVYEFA